jgi:hypothetical protein
MITPINGTALSLTMAFALCLAVPPAFAGSADAPPPAGARNESQDKSTETQPMIIPQPADTPGGEPPREHSFGQGKDETPKTPQQPK